MKFVKHIVSVLIFSGVCLTSFAAAQSASSGWKWRFKTLETISDVQSNERTVFIAEYDGNVYAVNKQNGRKEWELTGGKNKAYGIWLKRNVLITSGGSGAGKIQAFAADTRRPLWSESLEVKDEASIFAVSENTVFKAENYNGLKALDLQTGKQQWINRDCEKISDIRVDGNLLYVIGSGGNLFALDAATGATVWKYKRHGYFDLLAMSDKALIFSYSNGRDKTLLAFEKSSGRQLWSEKLDTYDGFSAVYETGRLYITLLNSPTMVAFDTATGKQIWKAYISDSENEEDGYSNNALDAATVVGDLLYSGGRNGFLYVFQKQTGKLIWKKKLAPEDLSSPLVVGNTGYLSARNKLFAVELKQGRVLWQFSAYGTIYPLKYQDDGTLYFQSQEKAYNALDLKSIERLARLKKPLGTRAPARNALDSMIPQIMTERGEREKIDGIFSEPDFAENKAYFTVTNQTSEQGLLYEINLPNGALRKVSEIKADELSMPKILRGRAYFFNTSFNEQSLRKPFLYGIEIESGKAIVAQQIEPVPQLAPEIAADLIFISGKYQYLYAYNLSGEFQWRIYAHLEYFKHRFISADEKSIYLRRTDKILSAVDFASGNVAWLFEKQSEETDSIQTLSEPNEKTILVGTYHDALYNLDKTDGRIIWKTAFGDDSFNHIMLAAGGATAFVVTAADNASWLQAIDVSDGKVLWEKSVGSENPAYLFGEDVCAADAGGFYCFKQADGSRSVSYQTDKKFFGFSPDGILLYSTEDERSNRLTTLQGVSLREGKVIWNINLRALGKAPQPPLSLRKNDF